ncbi:uncharacterized protein [Panulirus ornatus]|uniref:uncharacterized protein n=1 Tax=Panulirus ornatus TaxID=150431 RepID=UPI003A858D92
MGRKRSRSKKQELVISRLPVQPYKPHLPQSLLTINELTFQKSSGRCETVGSHQKTVDFTCESADSVQKTLNFKCDTLDCQQEAEVVTCKTTVWQKVTNVVQCEAVYNQQKTGNGKYEIDSSQEETANARNLKSKGSTIRMLKRDTNFPDSSVCSSAENTYRREIERVKKIDRSGKVVSARNDTLYTIANKDKRVCAKSDGKKVQVHSCPRLPFQVEKNIKCLLNENVGGICVEKFCSSCMHKFGSCLIPLDYGYSDVIDLLQGISHIVSLKYDESENQVLLLPKADKDEANLVKRTSKHLDTVIATFQSVLKEHQGGIMLDHLISEYEMRTGKKLEISELGFKSIPDLLSHLTDVFKVFQHEGQQFTLFDPAISDLQLSRCYQCWEVRGSSHDCESRRTLNQEVIARLRILLEEEFPGGLDVDELIGAYRGFYGATLEDLNHESYGYRTLEALLSAHPEVVSVHYQEGGVIIQANHPLFSLHLDQVQPSWPLNVADVGDSYQRLDVSTLMPVEKMVDVVIGEVYTPHRFWVIHRGNHTSQSLNDLMDCMFEFYSTRIGDRFHVPQERIAIGAPVVALYAEDMNFYRALITSLEDLRTVKLFFVDYGTICQCDCDSLRLVHKRFFSLPAQAVKAALSDVIPQEGRFWSRAASKSFLQMVQNKGLVAHILPSKETTYMSLWDTTGEKDISIGEALILQGWAVPRCSPPTEELELLGSSCYSSFVHTRCSSPKRQITESIIMVADNENFDTPSKTNAESPSVSVILNSVTQTMHPTRTVAENLTESPYVFSKPQSVTPVNMVDSKTYSQSSFCESCNNHMVNPNLVKGRNKSCLNSTHEFNLVTTASGFEVGNIHQPVSHFFPFEIEALMQRLYEDYHLVNTALKYIKSPFSEEFPYLDLTSRTPLSFTQALSSSYPVATVSAFSSVNNRHCPDRSFPLLASSVSDKVIACQSNEVYENHAEVSTNLKAPQRFNLFDESPLENQRALQELQLLSRNFAQVTDVERICFGASPGFAQLPTELHAMSPLPGFGPSTTNFQSQEPPGYQAFPENLKTIDPSPRYGTFHPIFQNVGGSPSSEPLSADCKMLSNPPQFASSSLNFQVTDPLSGIGSLLDKHQATASSGFQTNVTKVLTQPIMCTGVEDELFYSDEEDEIVMQHSISPEKHYYYDCMVKPVVLTAGNTLHVLVLDGTAFVLSIEISCLLWHADVLESLLHQKGITLSKIELEKGTNANVIIQLIESGVNAVYDDNGKVLPSLTAYPLKIVPRILQIFSYDDSLLLSTVKNLIHEFAKEDPVQFHSEKDTIENNPTSKMHLFTPGIPPDTSYCKTKTPSNPCVLDKKLDDCSNMSEDEILFKKHIPKVETFGQNENNSQCLKFSNSNEEHDCYPAVMNDKVCSPTKKKETLGDDYLQEQRSDQTTQLTKPPSKPPLALKPLIIPPSDSRSMIRPSHYPKSVTKPPCDFKHLQKSWDPNPSPEVSDFKHLVKPQDLGPSTEVSHIPKPLTISPYDHKSFIKPSVAPKPLIRPSHDPELLTKHFCDPIEVTKPISDSKSLTRSPHDSVSLVKSPTGPESLIIPALKPSLCKPIHDPKPLVKPPHNCKTDDRCYDSESLIMDPHDFSVLAKSSCDVKPLSKPPLKPKPLAKLHAQPLHKPPLMHRLRFPHLESLTKPICSLKPLPTCPFDIRSPSDFHHDPNLLTEPPCDSRSLSDAPSREPLTKPPLVPKSVTKPLNDLPVTKPFNDPKLVSKSLNDLKPLLRHHDCDLLTGSHGPKPVTKPFNHKPVTDSSLHNPGRLNKSPCDLNPSNKPPLNLKQLSKSSDDSVLKIKSFALDPETDLTVHDPKSLNKPSHDPNSLEKPSLNLKAVSKSPDDPELNIISFAPKAETDWSLHDSMPVNKLPHDSKQIIESFHDPKLLTKPHNDLSQ